MVCLPSLRADEAHHHVALGGRQRRHRDHGVPGDPARVAQLAQRRGRALVGHGRRNGPPGLPQQPEGAYYTLYLTRGGKPIAPCGFFRVNGKTTTVHLNAPYKLRKFDGWVVTRQVPPNHEPKFVVMQTTGSSGAS